MKCPKCKKTQTHVKEKRTRREYAHRVRVCGACGCRFRTMEIWVPDDISVQEDPEARLWYIDKMKSKYKRIERRRRSESHKHNTD